MAGNERGNLGKGQIMKGTDCQKKDFRFYQQ